MLNKSTLSKTKLNLYKSYLLNNGDTMTLKTDGDTFSTNINSSIKLLIEELIQEDPSKIEHIDELKGKLIQVLHISLNMNKLVKNPKSEEIEQYGDTIKLNYRDFQFGMKLYTYQINNFDYSISDDKKSIKIDNISSESKAMNLGK